MTNLIQPDFDSGGRAFLYDQGKRVGVAEVEMLNGVRITKQLGVVVRTMMADAKADGVELTFARAFVLWSEQLEIRKRHVKDKSQLKDIHFLVHANASEFSPLTARPGFSNHHDGSAIDFNVTLRKAGKVVGTLPAYEWLCKNAFRYKLIRTVPSERWHWELRPAAKSRFDIVTKQDPTWDGIALS